MSNILTEPVAFSYTDLFQFECNWLVIMKCLDYSICKDVMKQKWVHVVIFACIFLNVPNVVVFLGATCSH